MSRDNTSKAGGASWQACRTLSIAIKTSKKIMPMIFLFTVVISSRLCHYPTHSEFYPQKSNVDRLFEKHSQRIKRLWINPAHNSLPTPFHFNQACSVKFFNVVRNC
jgi:hypothetical protein